MLITQTLDRIAASIDPCGDSEQITELLEKVRGCPRATYHICTDFGANRNWFDRPGTSGVPASGTINWNPTLHDEIEPSCSDETTQPVLRDPTASLVHELMHAAQDCDGLNPGEHEFDAVRIENIYRRAAGLCQRSRYGEDPLPLDMLTHCAPGHCLCTAPTHKPSVRLAIVPPAGAANAAPGDGRAPDE